MPARRTQHRLTLHVEGRGGGALMLSDGARELAAAPGLADFEKIATTELRGDVSRLLLFQQVCDIMCTEALLYEDSVEVATQIATAVELGSVVDAAPGSRQPLVGRGTSANLYNKCRSQRCHLLWSKGTWRGVTFTNDVSRNQRSVR